MLNREGSLKIISCIKLIKANKSQNYLLQTLETKKHFTEILEECFRNSVGFISENTKISVVFYLVPSLSLNRMVNLKTSGIRALPVAWVCSIQFEYGPANCKLLSSS